MGWTFSYHWQSQKDVEKHLKETLSPGYECLATSSRFGEMYMAVATPNNNRYIVVFLIKGNKTDGWGYKAIDESMGPFYYNCPEKLLKLSTSADTASVEWREKCREKRKSDSRRKRFAKTLKFGVHVDTVFGEVEFQYFCNKSETQFVGCNIAKQKVFRYSVSHINVPDDFE